MGTANFLYNDTLYAIDNTDDEFLHEDIKLNIKHELKQFDNLKHVKVYYNGDDYDNSNRNFGGVIVVECVGNILVEELIGNDDIDFNVTQRIILRSGYYSGFNLDRDYEDDYHIHESLDELDDINSIVDDYLDIDRYFAEDEDLKDEYIQRIVKPKFESIMREVQDEFDKVYHTLGKEFFEQYGVTAQFSNGETIYHKIGE